MVRVIRHSELGTRSMKSVHVCQDAAKIKELLSIDNMYDSVSYDGSPPLEQYVPTGVWLVLKNDDTEAGLINLTWMNNATWICHVIIYSEHRGNGSEMWAKQAAAFMHKHVGARKFLAITPYKNAKRYAERAGFEYLTTLKNSIIKNNKLLDQYMLELDVQSTGEIN